ncbi:MAG: hypothetical protein HQ515_12570 [Phycisphaeraceae bacterium]|nr:hypothetical protein [Phycisphaeraceae bacterium]
MSVATVFWGVANRAGWLAGKGHNAIVSAKTKVKESAKLPEKIQKAMLEKLSQTLYKQAQFMVEKISDRMEVITAVAGPFYEKVRALSAQGPISESQLWHALDSIEAAKNLTEEERTLLVNLFGQMAGTQKSKVVDAVVIETDPVNATGSVMPM